MCDFIVHIVKVSIHLKFKDMKITKLDIYFIITLLYKDEGISFNDISNFLMDNGLSEYIVKNRNQPNVRRSAIPELKSSPSSIKKYVFKLEVNSY